MDDDDDIDDLTGKQEEAILALLSEPSIAKAAAKIEVSEKTLRRWLDDAQFSTAFRKARREAFGQAIALVQRYASMAVNVMARVMSDTSAPPNSRVSAASAVLRFGREGIELDDLAARIEALERAAAATPKNENQWGSRIN